MRVFNRLLFSEAIRAIGPPGVVGIALLAFAASYAFSTLLPSWRELAQYRAAADPAQANLRETFARLAARDHSPAAQLRRFYDVFPADSEAPISLSRVYAAAAEKRLPLPRGEYAFSVDPQTGLMRYGIVFPVHGSYAQIREFVAASLQAVPTLALDQVSFERPRITDNEVRAQIRLTLYLKRPT